MENNCPLSKFTLGIELGKIRLPIKKKRFVLTPHAKGVCCFTTNLRVNGEYRSSFV